MKKKVNTTLNNSLLNVIKRGFVCLSGMTIVSSIFTLLSNFPVSFINSLFTNFFGKVCIDMFSSISNSFYFFISIYVAVAISYQSSKYFKLSEMVSILTTLLSYFCLMPLSKIKNTYFLDINNCNSKGVFLAILLGVLVPYLLSKIYKNKFKINLLKEVPQDVSKSFESIIPTLIIMFICLIINIIVKKMGENSLVDLIYKIIQIPILNLSNNLISIIIMNFIITISWFFGFNGTYIVNTVMTPILLTLSMENLIATTNGVMPPNIITSTFQSIYTNFGGCGSTLALVIILLFFSKNNESKKIAKISIIPSLFNINESIVYGLPVIMNLSFLIPFILCPIINVLISYYSMYFGIVKYTNGIQLPWTMPIIISGYLSSGFSGMILQIILLFINMLIYFPFVLKYEGLQDK